MYDAEPPEGQGAVPRDLELVEFHIHVCVGIDTSCWCLFAVMPVVNPEAAAHSPVRV